MTFKPQPDRQLQQLSDDRLIVYIREARAAGDLAAGRRALAFLVYGYEADARRRLALRVPGHVVDDLAHDALVRAIAAAFAGGSVGEFRSWLATIVERTAVDWYRRAGRRVREAPLPSEHVGEEVWGDEPFTESAAGAVELRVIVEEAMATFNARHTEVIELHVFGALPASEVCERIDGMSEDNVAQIASRFRARLRDRLNSKTGAGA